MTTGEGILLKRSRTFSAAVKTVERLIGRLPVERDLCARIRNAAEKTAEACCGGQDAVPEELQEWKEYYLACLWEARWRKAQSRAEGPLTTREIRELAAEYRRHSTAQVRYAILKAAWSRGRAHGVEALAHFLGVGPEEAVLAATSWLKLWRRIRNGRAPGLPQLPPDPWEEAARAECGSGGPRRYGRRDTHSLRESTQQTARRL